MSCDNLYNARIKAALEGNYITWTYQWTKNFNTDWGGGNVPLACELVANEDTDMFIMFDGNSPALWTIHILDGSLIEYMWCNGYSYYRNQFSVFKTYFAVIFKDTNNSDHATIRIYKNLAIIQTIDLTDLYGWTYNYYQSGITISQDGKYILVWDSSSGDCKLFTGS